MFFIDFLVLIFIKVYQQNSFYNYLHRIHCTWSHSNCT